MTIKDVYKDFYVTKIKNNIDKDIELDGCIWSKVTDCNKVDLPSPNNVDFLVKIKAKPCIKDNKLDFCSSNPEPNIRNIELKFVNEVDYKNIVDSIREKISKNETINWPQEGNSGSEKHFKEYEKNGNGHYISISRLATFVKLAGVSIGGKKELNITVSPDSNGPADAKKTLFIKHGEYYFNFYCFLNWANDLFENLETEIHLLGKYRNLILEGVPGTGKTFVFKEIVDIWYGDSSSGANEESVIDKAITLHPAVTYEDFMEGLRPVSNQDEDGTVEEINAKNIDTKNTIFKKIDFFHVKRGISSESGFYYKYGFFLRICCEAVNNPYKDYLVLLDEINRCNIPKVFGDLITTIENSKRATWDKVKGFWDLTNSQVVALPGSGRLFFIPENIYIVATMNTSDRSVAPLDAALRRRFAFHRIQPLGFGSNNQSVEDISKLIWNQIYVGEALGPDKEFLEAVRFWKIINEKLKTDLGEDAMLGHSYLYDLAKKIKERKLDSNQLVKKLVEPFWNHDVLPDLSEIFNSSNYNQKEIEDFFSLNNALKGHFTVTKLAVGSNRSSRIVYKQGEKKVSDKIANSANTSE